MTVSLMQLRIMLQVYFFFSHPAEKQIEEPRAQGHISGLFALHSLFSSFANLFAFPKYGVQGLESKGFSPL